MLPNLPYKTICRLPGCEPVPANCSRLRGVLPGVELSYTANGGLGKEARDDKWQGKKRHRVDPWLICEILEQSRVSLWFNPLSRG